jgi:hypothetical protein
MGCSRWRAGADDTMANCPLGILILKEPAHDNNGSDIILNRAIRRAGFDAAQLPVWDDVSGIPMHNPRCVLAMGNKFIQQTTGLCGQYRGVDYLRGYAIPDNTGIPIIPTFELHWGQMSWFSVLMHDLKLAVATAACLPTTFFSPVLYRDYFVNQFVPYDVTEPAIPPGYITHPSEAHAWEFLKQVKDNRKQLLAYDIETPRSATATEDDSDELADTDILSIQFSLAVGTGIFLPWREPFVQIAKLALALPNPKVGANTWRFDDPLLRAHGCKLNGTLHDVRWAFHHLQPDLKSGLQFIASFYPANGLPHTPWKHWHGAHPEAYGIMDVDVLQRIFQ